MSRCEVYVIQANGDVEHFDDASCAPACAMHIWTRMSDRTGAGDVMDYTPLWRLWCKGTLSERDDTVLGFTFDGVWVAREHLPRLAAALESWWSENSVAYRSFDREAFEVQPTIPKVVEIIRRAHADETIRGVCFNQTSVNSNPWVTRDVDLVDEVPFNIVRDTVDANDQEPWELFQRMDSKRSLYIEKGQTTSEPRRFPHLDEAQTIQPPPDFEALEKAFHDALPRGAQRLVGDLGHYFRGALVATLRKYVESLGSVGPTQSLPLWFIERTDRVDSDDVESMVVAARTANEARATLPDNVSNWPVSIDDEYRLTITNDQGVKLRRDSWPDIRTLSVKRIGDSVFGAPRVVCVSRRVS